MTSSSLPESNLIFNVNVLGASICIDLSKYVCGAPFTHLIFPGRVLNNNIFGNLLIEYTHSARGHFIPEYGL